MKMRRLAFTMSRAACAFCFAAIGLSAHGSELTLQSSALEVRFDTATGKFSVADKRTGRLWQQAIPSDTSVKIEGARLEGDRIVAQLKAAIPFVAEIEIPEGHPVEVSVSIKAPAETAFPELNEEAGKWESGPGASFSYPLPFLCDFAKAEHLVTTLPGYLAPASEMAGGQEVKLTGDAADRRFNWMGTMEGESGLALYVATPDDASFHVSHVKAGDGAGEIAAYQPSWRSSLGRWGYDRKCVYYFSETGGHVALVSWVRDQYRQSGLLVTLEEKASRTPAVRQMAGTPIIWMWGEGRTNPGYIYGMKAQGIEKARLCFDPNHPPYPSADVVKAIQDCGYQLGIYNLYKNQLDAEDPDFPDALPLDSRAHWRTPDWKNFMLVRADGGLWNWSRMATPSGGEVGFYIISPSHYTDVLERDVAEEEGMYPTISSRLLDTWGANPLREDYHPGQETTRGFDREKRAEVLRWLANHGTIVGTENNSSWYIAVGHYSEGSMSLELFRSLAGREGRQNATEDGDEPEPDPGAAPSAPRARRNRAASADTEQDRPAAAARDQGPRGFGAKLMAPQEPAERMIELVFEPRIRVPLFELLAHDCLVSTYHWRDSSQRFGTEYWDYKDLWNILYGTLPMWHLDPDEWEANKARFVQCYQNVCRWHEKVFGAQMVDHRFLTDDRFVQQTRFSNGWAVTVNFRKDQPYSDDGATLPAMGFREFRWKE